MRSAPVLKLLLTLLPVLSALAFAQDDQVVHRYRLAGENLDESRARMLTDPEASNEELNLAAATLRFIADEAGRADLTSAFDAAVDRARQATANRSTPDHQIQTELLRAGLRKALFESALAGWESDRGVASTRLGVLLADLGSTPEGVGVREDSTRQEVALRVQALGADLARAALAQAPAPRSDLRAPTYRSLGAAYGHYLLLQDSSLADARINEGFGAAAQATVEGDAEAFAAASAELQAILSELAARVRSAAEEGPDEAADGSDGSTLTVLPLDSDGTVDQAATAAQNETEAAQPPASRPDESAGADAGPPPDAPVSEEREPARPEQSPFASDQPQDGVAAGPPTPGEVVPGERPGAEVPGTTAPSMAGAGGQVRDGSTTGMPESDAGDAVARAQESDAVALAQESDAGDAAAQPRQGVTSDAVAVDSSATAEAAAAAQAGGATQAGESARAGGAAPAGTAGGAVATSSDSLYGVAGRYLLAIQEGRLTDADDALSEFRSLYGSRPATDPALDAEVRNLVAALSESPQVRVADAGALLALVDEFVRSRAGGPSSERALLTSSLTSGWAGWPRTLVWLVLGLFSLLPLYLLNLAFGGGGNRNWRMVGLSLLLLLAVPIYEGLRALLAVAAQLAGMPSLRFLAPYSLVDTPLGQLVMAALAALAILLASIGLYGICVQFGLIRGRRARDDARHTMVTRAATGSGEAVVDWDEEF